MYERFYGLQERPFDLSPNPRFLCFTAQHREALAHLEYGLAGRPGILRIAPSPGQGGGAWPFSSYGGSATARFGY